MLVGDSEESLQLLEQVTSFTGWVENDWMTERTVAQGGSTIAVTEGMTVAGTLAGVGTIQGAVAFQEGSSLAVSSAGYLTIEGIAAGSVALDVSALGTLSVETLYPLLLVTTPSEEYPLVFTNLPEGFEVVPFSGYEGTMYYLARTLEMPIKATLVGDVAWQNLAWTDAAGTPVTPAELELRYDAPRTFVVTTDSTLSILSEAVTGGTVMLMAPLTVETNGHTLAFETDGSGLMCYGDLTVTGDGTLFGTYDTFRYPDGRSEAKVTLEGSSTLEYTITQRYALSLPNLVGTGSFIGINGTDDDVQFSLYAVTRIEMPLEIRGAWVSLVTGGGDYSHLPDIRLVGAGAALRLPNATTPVNAPDATLTLGDGADVLTVGSLVTVGTLVIEENASISFTLPESTQPGTKVLAFTNCELPENYTMAEGEYNLTITSIEIEDGKLVVAAELTFMTDELDPETSEVVGKVAAPLTLVPGVKVELVPVTLDGTEPGDVIGTAEVGADGALTLPSPEATSGTVLFKVRLTPPSAE